MEGVKIADCTLGYVRALSKNVDKFGNSSSSSKNFYYHFLYIYTYVYTGLLLHHSYDQMAFIMTFVMSFFAVDGECWRLDIKFSCYKLQFSEPIRKQNF